MLADSEKTTALESGIISLTGGRCLNGNFIINIPTNKLDELAKWSTENVTTLFFHLSAISKYVKAPSEDPTAVLQNVPVACLADLRHASTLAVRQLAVCLESVEIQQRGTIGAVYFLKPRSTTRSHMLKKLLGVKPSKKRPRVPLFKVVLMKTVQELYGHIDVSQLTADFCGTIRYNHVSWLHLYSVVIKCAEGCQDLLTKLPSVRDKVDLLQEYETDGLTSSQTQHLLADLIERFHVILSESSLPLYLTQCKQTIFLLDHPSSDNQLSLVHPEMVSGLREHLRSTYAELDQWSTDLGDAWRVTENRLTVLIQFYRHKERAKEIERKICQQFLPLLREHPIVGKTLSQAELYRAHFTTTLYDPAKELLSQATEILEAVQRLKSDVASQPATNFCRRGSSTSTHNGAVFSDQDVADISKCLTTSIQPFATQLQQLQQLYVSIHIFHLLFEKALIWYKKVLKFIPESLLQRCSTQFKHSASDSTQDTSRHTRECLVYMPTEWLGAVRVFLSRHPPPGQKHIDRIDESIPQHVDRKMRSQARSLALRLQLLQRVLTSTRLPLKVITAVLAWRAELFGLAQHDKASGAHHTANPVKDLVNPGLSTNQDTQNHDRATVRDPHKPNGNRPPEKPPRAKKFSSFDHEAASKSSSHAGAQVGSVGHEVNKGSEKSPARRNSKLMPRSKSVDFNFNSSSTDGSVFDYDKALAQAETQTATVKIKPMPRRPRTSMKDSKVRRQDDGHKAMNKDEGVFSDPSALLRTKGLSDNTKGDSESPFHDVQKLYSSESGNEESKPGFLGNRNAARKQMGISEPESHRSTPDVHKHAMLHPQHPQHSQQQPKRKPIPSDETTLSPSSDERFIRITFTPKQLNAHKTRSFRFSSADLLETTRHSKFVEEEEEESGIDLAQGTDPYDSVINRIKEISSSDLTNIEKLKKVSELLSRSAMKQDASHKPVANKNIASKMSYSTIDLRQTAQDNDGRRIGTLSETDSANVSQSQNQSVRPVEAVQRMKKNLAKSMEELNVPSTYPDTNGSQFYQHQSPAVVDNHTTVRYVSQLKIQPVYRKTKKASKQEARAREYSPSAPDDDSSLTKMKDNLDTRSWSDVESFSHGVSPVSTSLSSQDPTPTSIKNPSRYFDIPLNTKDDELSKFLTPRFIPDDSDDVSPIDNAAPHENKRLPLTRPANINVFPSRNFISPSFLRPATSMIDLSSKRHPEMIFDLDVDIEQDYQALEDLELLQTMREDSLSNGYSKQTSKTQKRRPSDFRGEKLKDEMRDESLHQVGSLTPGNKGSQDTKNTADVRVSHLSTRWSSFDGQEETARPYLSTSDINFDRLTREADHEYRSQEEVAESLRKTQKILEEEESRCRHQIHHLSDPSVEEDEVDDLLGAAGRISHATSVDNGYGSWASKFMRSTSSEGGAPDRDWRKLSSSSADSSAKSPGNTKANKLKKMTDDGADGLEACDTVHELPIFEKPLTGTDLY